MNWDFFRDIGKQLGQVWKDIKAYQKFTVVLVVLLLFGTLGFMVVNAASTTYAPLYPPQRLLISDASSIKSYLDSERVDYRIEGDSTILVPKKDIHKIRMDLAAVGLPKMHNGKGFELFDTNTWIKGEKELQILEMRALRGELERDISEYENIKGASVIIDMPPPRPFGGSLYKTKSSVILTLMPGARLSASQLRSITYHISGAVRGLTPNMVAISDTTGKLYQAFDPDGDFDALRSSEISVEERLKSKVDGMLAMIVGYDNFYSTVQVTMLRDKTSRERSIFSGTIDGVELGDPVVRSVTESGLQLKENQKFESGTPGSNTEAVAGAVIPGQDDLLNRSENRNQLYREMAVPIDHIKILSNPGKIESISIGVLIDKTITLEGDADIPEGEISDGKRNAEALEKEIESQLKEILEGYGLAGSSPSVDFVEFDKARAKAQKEEETVISMMELGTKIGTGFLILIIIIGMLWTFNKFWKRHMTQPPELEDDEEPEAITLLEESQFLEVEAMMESIQGKLNEDPRLLLDTIRDWLEEETPVNL
jgi:flagellar M-ring protein FliF